MALALQGDSGPSQPLAMSSTDAITLGWIYFSIPLNIKEELWQLAGRKSAFMTQNYHLALNIHHLTRALQQDSWSM